MLTPSRFLPADWLLPDAPTDDYPRAIPVGKLRAGTSGRPRDNQTSPHGSTNRDESRSSRWAP